MLIATLRTGLTGMPGVYLDDSDTSFLGFIGDEVIQLSECPTVQTSLSFGFLMGDTLANSSQVLKHDRAPRSRMLHQTLREYMLAIPVEALLPFAQLFQVTFGRLRSVGLQFSLEAKRTTINLFPVTVAKELSRAGDSRPIQPQVNPDHLIAV